MINSFMCASKRGRFSSRCSVHIHECRKHASFKHVYLFFLFRLATEHGRVWPNLRTYRHVLWERPELGVGEPTRFV